MTQNKNLYFFIQIYARLDSLKPYSVYNSYSPEPTSSSFPSVWRNFTIYYYLVSLSHLQFWTADKNIALSVTQ